MTRFVLSIQVILLLTQVAVPRMVDLPTEPCKTHACCTEQTESLHARSTSPSHCDLCLVLPAEAPSSLRWDPKGGLVQKQLDSLDASSIYPVATAQGGRAEAIVPNRIQTVLIFPSLRLRC